MKILLTGSAGFIGSHLSLRLLREGHQLIGVDNYLSGQRRNTERLLQQPGFRFIEADVSDGLGYDPATEGRLDWLLHFASPASPPHYQAHAIETLRVGAEGTRQVLELAQACQAGFMLASSSEVYGDPLCHPQQEDYWGHVNPNGLRSCYDEAKRYAEALTMAYHRVHGLNSRIIRIFNTYGPYMRADDGRVVTNFINQGLRGQALTVYGDGQQTRSFQYIDDLIDGIVRLMALPYHQPVNLGNPVETSVQRFAEIVRDKLGSKLDIRYLPMPEDDPVRRKPDISRAQDLLGWQPQVSLDEGLEATIAYFAQHDLSLS